MQFCCFLAICATFLSVAHAEPLVVRSPDSAQTFARHTILWQQLRWLPARQLLTASITFSNVQYESQDEPRRDERFDFSFPGVELENSDGTFYIRKHGDRVAVARLGRAFFGKSIQLSPESRVEIWSDGGRISVALIGGQRPTKGLQWVEHEGAPLF